jgi:putative DNA primase/helicase
MSDKSVDDIKEIIGVPQTGGGEKTGNSKQQTNGDGVGVNILTAPQHSEEALALMFAERHANKLRFVAQWNQWFSWDGTCWREDKTRNIFSMARELCREVANGINKENERKRIASAKTRAAVVSLASEDRRLAATVEQWDANPWLLNTPDGVVDLHTGKLREHRPDDYMTKQTAASPAGACPMWKKFLKEVTGGDEGLQKYLQRITGYFLTGETYEQELFFFYGSGGNGKGVWVQTISYSRITITHPRSKPLTLLAPNAIQPNLPDCWGLAW